MAFKLLHFKIFQEIQQKKDSDKDNVFFLYLRFFSKKGRNIILRRRVGSNQEKYLPMIIFVRKYFDWYSKAFDLQIFQ